MPKKKKKDKILTIDTKDFPKWIQEEAKRRKISEVKAMTDLFDDGFMVYVHETATGKASIKYVNLWGGEKKKTTSELGELRRLRKKFGPVSAAIDFHKNSLLGSGISVTIDDPKDNFKKEIRKYIKEFIKTVYQDVYTKGLGTILDIMLDEALTTGASGAEIVYDKDVDFYKYAELEEVVTGEDKKEILYKVVPPSWKNDFEGIKRLKILNNAIERLKLYRHPISLEALFWTLDEKTQKETPEDIARSAAKFRERKKTLENAIKLHTWQIFWIVVNRRNWDYVGESIITPAVKLSQILEKIQGAIGEGIYRAGNKKYFIVCGTEKRPWGDPWIRNVLALLKEMGEKNWTSMPVPSGFDIKEIGGEVFEGRNVIDHFVAMIASSMDVPKELIDVGRRGRTSDKPWVVSGVGHRRRQVMLEEAIVNQLFARHLWCKYGKKKAKQGGKGEMEIYIPKVKWLREDQFNRQQHIDIIMKGLNVANPLNPLVKLEMERDFCKIMGYDDVILPSQEELKKELDELEKQQLEQMKKGPKQKGMTKPPQPPTQEKLQKRLEKGAHTAKKPSQGPVSKKGVAKPMGGTRVPVHETAPPEPQKVDVNINIKTRTEPLEVKPIKSEPAKVDVTVKTKSEPSTEKIFELERIKEKEKSKRKKSKKEIEIERKQKEEDKKRKKALEEERLKTEKKKQEILKKIGEKVEGHS